MMAQTTGALCGIAAAVLFGVSVPLVKLIAPTASPILVGGLLYSGGGVALLLSSLRATGARAAREAPLQADDWPIVAGLIGLGAVLGPICMLVGLQRLSGVAASLLLSLEAPLTILLAGTVFGEHLSQQERLGVVLMLGGAMLLNVTPGIAVVDWRGAAALSAAALCWAFDNNLTQRLSLRDPVQIALVKTLSGGAVLLGLAAALGDPWPPVQAVAALLGVGAASLGVSLVLDTYALRLVGAAREAAYFLSAPFIGAATAVPLLGDSWGLRETAVAGLMVAGVVCLQRAAHAHLHVHTDEHEHWHRHDDDHHDHHDHLAPAAHSHPHRHRGFPHRHRHVSDAHHRHGHSAEC